LSHELRNFVNKQKKQRPVLGLPIIWNATCES
jgi:hypothetical protein